MKSIATRNSVVVDENLHSSKLSRRKQGSTTLRSLKESFKFRGSISPKKAESQAVSNSYTSPSKIRRSSLERQESRKTKQRFSAQRVSLFKYEYVRVRSSSVLRRGSNSTISSDTTRSSDNASLSSTKSRGSVRVKPTTLMAKGVLEIYQIYTPKTNAADKQQEMNYLSLGRKDNIVHPILPRLQVTKTMGSTKRFIIHFYNPDRFWEIEFLAPSAAAAREVLVAAREFESVISKICDFSVVDEEPIKERTTAATDADPSPQVEKETVIESESGAGQGQRTSLVEAPKQEKSTDSHEAQEDDDDSDDLEYLLEEGEEEEEEEEKGVQRKEKKSNDSQTMSGLNGEMMDDSQDGAINEAFRRAMQSFKPSALHSHRGSTTERLLDLHCSRRFSSYQPLNDEEQSRSFSRRLSYIGTKRSSSVPTWFYYEPSAGSTRRRN